MPSSSSSSSRSSSSSSSTYEPTTYCTNSELYLSNGQSVDAYLTLGISDKEQFLA